MNSRGCQPTVEVQMDFDPEGVAHRCDHLGSVVPWFGPFRAGNLVHNVSVGSHPRLFMFQPVGLGNFVAKYAWQNAPRYGRRNARPTTP